MALHFRMNGLEERSFLDLVGLTYVTLRMSYLKKIFVTKICHITWTACCTQSRGVGFQHVSND
eukprot:3177741-Amphidinium_carterae.1